MSFNPTRKRNSRSRLFNAGYEAQVGPNISDVEPERVQGICLALSNAGVGALEELVSLGVLDLQRQAYVKAKRAGVANPTEEETRAPVQFREVLYEVLKLAKCQNICAIVLTYTFYESGSDLPAAQLVEPISYGNFNDLYPEWGNQFDTTCNFFVLDVPIVKGDKGDTGEPGQDGADGQDGANGNDGADGATGPAGPAGPPGGSGGGTAPSDGGGSGENGAPQTGDIKVYQPNGCSDPIINFTYCHDSFGFDHADLYPAIVDFATASGKFNPLAEDLVSADLSFKGLCYAGVVVTVDVELNDEENYTGSGGSFGGILTIYNQGRSTEVPHEVETFGVPDVLEVSGYRYGGVVGVNFTDDPTCELTGTMSTYPLLGTANCHTPPTENDPAWLQVCVVGFVKRSTVCVAFLPYTHDFNDGQDCWGDAGRLFDSDNARWFFGGFDFANLTCTRQRLFYSGATSETGYTASGTVTIGSTQSTFRVELVNYTRGLDLGFQVINHTPSAPHPITYDWSIDIDSADWSPSDELQVHIRRANVYDFHMELA